ncbi:MAG TPA: bifunctional 2-polyprenyl-6-hydroxyphenol methylase/3-demethylubiquinol 3-O-methyltransferase UbiG [Xanthomonadales bacterium]|nr:bifunctional 2-polyprenyl-6-hydroxyphenol methylase/3-demethylubiquinol 3-O-methyltransferase UbiG [Xanthomonadales bacterium]
MTETPVHNLDPSERGKFEESASTWWDPDGPMKPLHDLNPARLQYVLDRTGVRDKAVLDVGCGGGILSEALAHKGATVTGIDVAEKVLGVARLHLLESGVDVNYEASTAEQKAQSDSGSFDVVTCMEMLEHVPDPDSVVAAISGLLKPGGQAFFSTLNRTPLAFALGIVGAEHIARICPRGTHRYDRFIRPSELSAWVRAADMEVLDIRGIHYNPLSHGVMVGGHLKMNYLLHARRPLAGVDTQSAEEVSAAHGQT